MRMCEIINSKWRRSGNMSTIVSDTCSFFHKQTVVASLLSQKVNKEFSYERVNGVNACSMQIGIASRDTCICLLWRGACRKGMASENATFISRLMQRLVDRSASTGCEKVTCPICQSIWCRIK